MDGKVIGAVTTYTGDEHAAIKGYQVRIIAVLKGAADPDAEGDGEHDLITDDETLAAVDGVSVHDRVEVQPWIEERGGWSFVSHDPLAVDLEMFAHLRGDG